VSKSRDGTRIALPFADTPVIKRNKEMRAQNKGKSVHRRSSAGSRGGRASSLIESGTSNGRKPNSSPCQSDPDHVADFEIDTLLKNPVQNSGGEQSSNLHMAYYEPDEQHVLESSANMTIEFTAVPHSDVDVIDFYKLIDQQGLTEQKRMHQLLIWCASRALITKPRPDDGTSMIETLAIDSGRFRPRL
jgi:hypothetical protein